MAFDSAAPSEPMCDWKAGERCVGGTAGLNVQPEFTRETLARNFETYTRVRTCASDSSGPPSGNQSILIEKMGVPNGNIINSTEEMRQEYCSTVSTFSATMIYLHRISLEVVAP